MTKQAPTPIMIYKVLPVLIFADPDADDTDLLMAVHSVS
eukprot:CAMPEP_0176369452 /NCGR_PEP_ID=MMETSP0126-20121128/23297_1 /TAXON_ID=141414 ORGANISM="Strombidinopsis acuminatum, Strain SPMC142" /NCGR_SAMPLE_ID=MMETSP0126 /ASSEMBLY_ACC=CAM_ASM_000229 /LENGTH=38 /DNA_ID= /DNA_START= /DNA_END= /DNA_ORIENTATION=